MTASDQVILALTCWRENRGGGYAGMQSVANVVMNRAKKSGRSPYAECVLPWQFSSITANELLLVQDEAGSEVVCVNDQDRRNRWSDLLQIGSN